MLTTVAMLVIVLGLMVSLARDVRERSAQALTETILRQLDTMMTQYADRNQGRVPEVTAFPPPGAVAPESAFEARPGSRPATSPARVGDQRPLLLRAALANSRDTVRALRAESPQSDTMMSGLPVSVFDVSLVRDAWGSPIVFMSQMHPWIGTAPRDKPYFFLSAGPDRDYLSRDDNLYSYEELIGGITHRRGE
ncbi:hypothetical protein [Humisphaera borealis]|nr:hypothetical protein [Humisphaera borealis]